MSKLSYIRSIVLLSLCEKILEESVYFFDVLDDFFFTKTILHHAYKESNGKFLNNKKEEINLVFFLL